MNASELIRRARERLDAARRGLADLQAQQAAVLGQIAEQCARIAEIEAVLGEDAGAENASGSRKRRKRATRDVQTRRVAAVASILRETGELHIAELTSRLRALLPDADIDQRVVGDIVRRNHELFLQGKKGYWRMALPAPQQQEGAA